MKHNRILDDYGYPPLDERGELLVALYEGYLDCGVDPKEALADALYDLEMYTRSQGQFDEVFEDEE